MYSKDFYITQPVWNNAFSFDERKNKKLFVPKLKKIESFDEIELLASPSTEGDWGGEIGNGLNLFPTFQEYDFDGNMQSCYGLKNLYALTFNQSLCKISSHNTSSRNISPCAPSSHNTSPSVPLLTGEGSRNVPLYLVDNHNHAFYFWYLARSQGIISDNAMLYHIDEHADMRDPWQYLLKPESEDIQQVFEYTNFFLNVGNYIVPAQKEGLIGEVVQIRSESALREYLNSSRHLSPTLPCFNFEIVAPLCFSLVSCQEREQESKSAASFPFEGKEFKIEVLCEQECDNWRSIILNLDLDFFEPELDFIDYDLKKRVILDIARKADLITVCTSPYFIDQERALRVFRDLFDK